MTIKNKSKDYYYDKFNELVNSGTPIIDNTTQEIFEAAEGETFRQCYEDTPQRRTFPKHWFVSNRGNLISVCENKLVLIHKNPRPNSGKFSYKYMITNGEDASTLKNIELHNLVGLVFESDSYGLAGQKIEEEGVQAFGVRTQEGLHAQGHHLDGDDSNNDPGNIKFVTARVHSMFDGVPKPDAPADKQYEFMEKLGDICEAESPGEITILFPGHTMDPETGKWVVDKSNNIISTKSVRVTEHFMRELSSMIKFLLEE